MTMTDARPATDQLHVLDHGFVRLDGCMGDDLSVVNAARVSFGRRSEALEDRDAGLIRFLMRERHGSPFEHNAFRFHIKCPIFVAREWMRHRVGSFNERSARYSQMPEEFYVPNAEDVRTQVGKPGSYRFEAVGDELAETARETLEHAYREAYEAYRQLLAEGVAKEVARSVLPVGLYTEFYWTINARSLMNFVSLRNSETAQLEIRRFAEAVEELWSRHMPLTHAAFIENARTAP
jgi:thymidylate synthase (FAD)